MHAAAHGVLVTIYEDRTVGAHPSRWRELADEARVSQGKDTVVFRS